MSGLPEQGLRDAAQALLDECASEMGNPYAYPPSLGALEKLRAALARPRPALPEKFSERPFAEAVARVALLAMERTGMDLIGKYSRAPVYPEAFVEAVADMWVRGRPALPAPEFKNDHWANVQASGGRPAGHAPPEPHLEREGNHIRAVGFGGGPLAPDFIPSHLSKGGATPSPQGVIDEALSVDGVNEDDAPEHFGNEAAHAWVCGYEAGQESVQIVLRAARPALAGRGDTLPTTAELVVALDDALESTVLEGKGASLAPAVFAALQGVRASQEGQKP